MVVLLVTVSKRNTLQVTLEVIEASVLGPVRWHDWRVTLPGNPEHL